MATIVDPANVERRYRVYAWTLTGLSFTVLFAYAAWDLWATFTQRDFPVDQGVTRWESFPDVSICSWYKDITFAFADAGIDEGPEQDASQIWNTPTVNGTGREATYNDINIMVDSSVVAQDPCVTFSTSVLHPNWRVCDSDKCDHRSDWFNKVLLQVSFIAPQTYDEEDFPPVLEVVVKMGSGDWAIGQTNWFPVGSESAKFPTFTVGATERRHQEVWGSTSYWEFSGTTSHVEVLRPRFPSWRRLPGYASDLEPNATSLSMVSIGVEVVREYLPLIIEKGRSVQVANFVSKLGGYISIVGAVSGLLFVRKYPRRKSDKMTVLGSVPSPGDADTSSDDDASLDDDTHSFDGGSQLDTKP